MNDAARPWISVADGAPYFVDDQGDWTPIGQNDAITCPELAPLFRRRDLPAVEPHLRWLAEHGVTCLRLMVKYAQVRHRYFERPVGRPQRHGRSCGNDDHHPGVPARRRPRHVL